MTITDIISKAYFLTKTNSSSFPAADMLIAVNNAYDRVVSLILQADGRWQWDDTNNTDFPIATASLVSGQNDYLLASTHLRILDVEVKDNGGTTFRKLDPIDYDDLNGTPPETYYATSGSPTAYDKLATSVIIWPAPNYSQAASLKVKFQRGPASFSSAEVTTGTKQPGFNSLYHDLIPLWVAYNYAISNSLQNANLLMAEIQRKEAALREDYGKRDKDDVQTMTMRSINFR